MMLRALSLIVSLAVFPALAFADARTIRDWTAECDNALYCMATGSGDGGIAMGGTGYRLRLVRQGGEGSSWSMMFLIKNVPQPKADGEMRISIDGGEVLSLYEESGYLRDVDGITFGFAGGSDLRQLFDSLKKGQKLTLVYETDEGKTQQESFSLSGLMAALLWIADKQNRIGKSQDISFPAGVDGEAALTASKAVMTKIHARVKIECNPLPENQEVQSFWLPGGFALHMAPCFSGPYNVSQLFFFERRDDLQLIYFADYDEGWSGTNQLFNTEFDPKTGRLSSFYKGRGIGDCGSSGQWVWSGYSFRLLEFRAWQDCETGRASDDWPVVFTYQAK